MLVPCEVATKCLLPAIRATIAKQLMMEHGLKQAEAAKCLGVSQPAISLYSRKIRGKAIDLENEGEIARLIQNLAGSLAEGAMSHDEFIPAFCEICRTVRAKGLMCELHKAFDPAIDIEKCGICTTVSTKCL